VAVKILRADLAQQPAARRRFEAEARAAGGLAHVNVVGVFDIDRDGDSLFLVMERLPGRNLADEIAEGPIAVQRVQQLGVEILAALSASHAAGVIHRDVKPGNVLLTADGHAKVSDFGIAKTLENADETTTTQLFATPAYLAPERIRGEAATPLSDVYSAGAVLYEALSGQKPFAADTPLAVLHLIEKASPAPLRELRRDAPDEMIRIIEQAMSSDPRRRFSSAADMATALEAYAAGDATIPVTLGTETLQMAAPAGDRTVKAPTRDRPSPRVRHRVKFRPRALIATVFVFLAVVGVTVAVSRGAGDTLSPAPPTTSGRPVTTPPRRPSTATLPPALEHSLQRLEQTVGQ
jgi:serine/threonine protein kinase